MIFIDIIKVASGATGALSIVYISHTYAMHIKSKVAKKSMYIYNIELPDLSPVRIPHIFVPMITRHALILRIRQPGPDIAGRHHSLHNLRVSPTTLHGKRRLLLTIRELVLRIHVPQIPSTDLHVSDTLRVPHSRRRGQGRSGRVPLRGARGVGAELAVHEEQFGRGKPLVEEGFERVGVVVQHVFQGFEAVGNVVRGIVPPAAAHAPFVVAPAAAGVVVQRAAVELELVDVGVQGSSDDHVVVLEGLGYYVRVQRQCDVLGQGV